MKGFFKRQSPSPPAFLQAPTGLPGRDPRGYPFVWGNYRLSWERAREHFLVMGATGSGKTVLLRRLMQSVFPFPGTGTNTPQRRALIYDSKKDMRSILLGMGIPEERIVILNPFDTRSVAWDIAADVRLLPEATELANLLIPVERESQPFFSNTARCILRGVVEVFIEKAQQSWTLRHIILACEQRSILKKLLEFHPPTKWLLGLMEKEQTWLDIRSTISSQLDRFRFIAAGWHAAQRQGKTVSIKQWLKSDHILLLGNDDNTRTELDIVNRLFFDKAAQLINAQLPNEAEGRQTWIFLDEVREAGRLNTLHSLLLRARSKNCAVVLGFQDTLGMEAIYGEKEARELMGCPGNLAILHLNANAQSARQWASEAIGQDEQVHESQGVSRDPEKGHTRSLNTNYALKPLYLPLDFYLLGRAGSERGLQGVFVVDEHLHKERDKWSPEEKVTISNDELFGNHEMGLCPEIEIDQNYIGRSNAELRLEPWQKEDTRKMPEIAVAFLAAPNAKDNAGIADLDQIRHP